MQNLEMIGQSLFISDNDSLENLHHLLGLRSVGTFISLQSNPLLADITGLMNLKTMGGTLEIRDNQVLTHLSGLDSLDYASISRIYLEENPALSCCEVRSICDFLDHHHHPSYYSIENNALGCSSESEIKTACDAIGISEYMWADQAIAFPNPSSGLIHFRPGDYAKDARVMIFDAYGRLVHATKGIPISLDLSGYAEGMFIIEIRSADKMVRERLIKI
jgi:hypothetical protein